jgi:ectoine hydroxylase-related dioxygenase (phytanoyl-CoA dioxygenase family)
MAIDAARRAELREKGFVVVPGLLSPEEVERYKAMLQEMSGISPESWSSSGRGFGGWNLTDGVSKKKDFWGLIDHPRLLEHLRALLGDGVKYLQHSDLQVGFSAVSWHRDNVHRTYGIGRDWDEDDSNPYDLVRVGIYLQSFEESNFRLGFIPGSHRFRPGGSALARRFNEMKFKVMGGLAWLGPKVQEMTPGAEWVATNPGDCIIFDPRILHSGSYIEALKLSMFVGYGIPSDHFADLQNYYRHVRPELGYQEFSDELVAYLRERDLFAEGIEDTDQIEDAYVPAAALRKVVERRTKESAGS